MLVSRQVEVGEAMVNDRLNMTARAAGFAMAYDETVGRPPTKSTQPSVPATAKADVLQSLVRAFEQLKAAKPAAGSTGWSFWKAA